MFREKFSYTPCPPGAGLPGAVSEQGSISGNEIGPLHVPIVPMSVKVPVAASTLYIETLWELEFVT